MDLYSSLER